MQLIDQNNYLETLYRMHEAGAWLRIITYNISDKAPCMQPFLSCINASYKSTIIGVGYTDKCQYAAALSIAIRYPRLRIYAKPASHIKLAITNKTIMLGSQNLTGSSYEELSLSYPRPCTNPPAFVKAWFKNLKRLTKADKESFYDQLEKDLLI